MDDKAPRAEAERIYVFVQHLGRRLRDIDRVFGISPTRFSALAGLAFDGPTSVSELAAFERVKRPSMTRLVQDMERDGLVERRPDPDDGRGVRIRITTRGRALVERVRQRKIGLVEDFLQYLEPDVLRTIGTSFKALEGLGKSPRPDK
jgi:DNA-binding MarR family transcriptional regulator